MKPLIWHGLFLVCSSLPLASRADNASPVIPLCPGLTLVTAINQTSGDYESIKRIMKPSKAAPATAG